MRNALVLLTLLAGLSGCASCFLDAIPQQLSSEPSLTLDCDPQLGG